MVVCTENLKRKIYFSTRVWTYGNTEENGDGGGEVDDGVEGRDVGHPVFLDCDWLLKTDKFKQLVRVYVVDNGDRPGLMFTTNNTNSRINMRYHST